MTPFGGVTLMAFGGGVKGLSGGSRLRMNSVAVAPLASAAEQLQAYAFAQPAQPLAQALNAFSRTTGQSVVSTLELPGVQAPALKGRFSAVFDSKHARNISIRILL